MSDINLNLYLLVPTILCLLSLTLILIRGRNIKEKRGNSFYISVIAFVTIYLVIVGGALYLDIYYQWDLNKYDLDKDGFFGSPNETTPDQILAMQRLTNDLGRNLSFITGLVFSGIVAGVLYLIIRTYKKLKLD